MNTDERNAVFKKLRDRFPHLCSHPDFQLYGFEIGVGWYDIAERMCERLSATAPDLRLVQVKNKVGQLRVYTDTPPTGQDIIYYSENESLGVCDACGGVKGRERSVRCPCGGRP